MRTDFLGGVDSQSGFQTVMGGTLVPYSPTMVNFKPGTYYATASAATNVTNFGPNNLRFNPFYVGEPSNFDRISVNQIAAGGDPSSPTSQLLRLGLYSSGLFGMPISLLYEFGQLAVGSGSGTGPKEITLSLSLPAGLYYLAGVFQGVTTTNPTFTGFTQSLAGITGTPTAVFVFLTGYTLGNTTGPLPPTAEGATPVASTMKVWMRAA